MKTATKQSRQRRQAIRQVSGLIETRVVACAVIGIIGGMLLSIAVSF
jgi:hypothetical protein